MPLKVCLFSFLTGSLGPEDETLVDVAALAVDAERTGVLSVVIDRSPARVVLVPTLLVGSIVLDVTLLAGSPFSFSAGFTSALTLIGDSLTDDCVSSLRGGVSTLTFPNSLSFSSQRILSSFRVQKQYRLNQNKKLR